MSSYFYGGSAADEKQHKLWKFVRKNFDRKIVNMDVADLTNVLRIECRKVNELFPRKKKYDVSVSKATPVDDGYIKADFIRVGGRGECMIAHLRFLELHHADDEITLLEIEYSHPES